MQRCRWTVAFAPKEVAPATRLLQVFRNDPAVHLPLAPRLPPRCAARSPHGGPCPVGTAQVRRFSTPPVKRSTAIRLVVMLAFAIGAALWWSPRPPPSVPATPAKRVAAGGRPAKAPPAKMRPLAAPPGLATPPRPTAEERAGRVEKIKRDYDDIRNKAAADYAAAGPSFPGGLNAFLRQLALLEREKRRDLAAVLDPRELEDLELKDTTAGQLVRRLLGETTATEEQRRAVFRLQLAFDDRFALTFDTSPAALLPRETERQALQRKIRGVLGDALFAAWLRGDGPEFGQFATFVAQQGLPPDAAFALWLARNDFTLRRLELSARTDLSNEQLRAAHAALARQTEGRVLAILGPGATQAGFREVLDWLPRAK